jgi:hypothetical protein
MEITSDVISITSDVKSGLSQFSAVFGSSAKVMVVLCGTGTQIHARARYRGLLPPRVCLARLLGSQIPYLNYLSNAVFESSVVRVQPGMTADLCKSQSIDFTTLRTTYTFQCHDCAAVERHTNVTL